MIIAPNRRSVNSSYCFSIRISIIDMQLFSYWVKMGIFVWTSVEFSHAIRWRRWQVARVADTRSCKVQRELSGIQREQDAGALFCFLVHFIKIIGINGQNISITSRRFA